MAYKIKIELQAKKEIAHVYEYILDNWGSKIADKFYGKFASGVRQMQKHPEIGRPQKNPYDYLT